MNWILQEPIIIQGITEPGVSAYAAKMKAYGTKVIAGVVTRKPETIIEDIPVFNLVEDITEQLGAVKTSLIFVAPDLVLDAAREAIAAGLRYLIIVTKGIPCLDMIHLLREMPEETLILGSGSGGIVIPQKACLGTLQLEYFQPGSVGLISCSEFLIYEVAWELNQHQIGQSIVVHMGNELISGSNLSQWLTFLDQDTNTKKIVVIQQIKDLAKFAVDLIETKVKKPIVIYLVGLYTPQETTIQDGSTIVTSYLSQYISTQNNHKKILSNLKKAGIKVVETPSQISTILSKS